MAAVTTWSIAGVALACTLSSSVWAQSSAPVPSAPNMPAPATTVPEKIEPNATGTTGNLSETLNRTEGVITPPAGLDSGMSTGAPGGNTGAMPVITPPGEPGGNQAVQPK